MLVEANANSALVSQLISDNLTQGTRQGRIACCEHYRVALDLTAILEDDAVLRQTFDSFKALTNFDCAVCDQLETSCIACYCCLSPWVAAGCIP